MCVWGGGGGGVQRDERLRAIGMLQTGRSQDEVANIFNISKSVIL